MTLVGMYLPIDPYDTTDNDQYTKYQSMEELWKNRNQHRLFLIYICMPGVNLGMSALKKYCLKEHKGLLLDVHQCSPSCTQPPEIITIVDAQLNIDDPNNLVKPFQESQMVLEDYMYDSLLSMSHMGLASLYHESIPLHYNEQKSRLESIYGDIYYVSKRQIM